MAAKKTETKKSAAATKAAAGIAYNNVTSSSGGGTPTSMMLQVQQDKGINASKMIKQAVNDKTAKPSKVDKAITGFAGAALDSLTGGAYNKGLEKAYGKAATATQKGAAGTAGTIAGLIAPAGAVGKAAKAATTGIKAAGWGAKIAKSALQGAITGGTLQTGREAVGAAMDKKLNAKKAAGNVAKAAALGAVVDGGLTGTGLAAKGAGKIIGKVAKGTKNVVTNTASAVKEKAAAAFGKATKATDDIKPASTAKTAVVTDIKAAATKGKLPATATKGKAINIKKGASAQVDDVIAKKGIGNAIAQGSKSVGRGLKTAASSIKPTIAAGAMAQEQNYAGAETPVSTDVQAPTSAPTTKNGAVNPVAAKKAIMQQAYNQVTGGASTTNSSVKFNPNGTPVGIPQSNTPAPVTTPTPAAAPTATTPSMSPEELAARREMEAQRQSLQANQFSQYMQTRQGMENRGLAGSGLAADANARLAMAGQADLAKLYNDTNAKIAEVEKTRIEAKNKEDIEWAKTLGYATVNGKVVPTLEATKIEGDLNNKAAELGISRDELDAKIQDWGIKNGIAINKNNISAAANSIRAGAVAQTGAIAQDKAIAAQQKTMITGLQTQLKTQQAIVNGKYSTPKERAAAKKAVKAIQSQLDIATGIKKK